MDGKLLILCDEDPRDEERLSIRDKNFLVSDMIDPDDNSDMLFVSFDALIPEDRTFIGECLVYGSFRENPQPDFMLRQKGKTNPKYGTIHGSIQEQCYLDTYLANIEAIKRVQNAGGDVRAEMLEMSVQYPFVANSNFIRTLSTIFAKNDVVRILPAFKKDSNPDVSKYRLALLEAWQNEVRVLSRNESISCLLEPMEYSEFGELYSRATDEMMKIMSLPIFGDETTLPRL